jgi:hypothetical protein
MKSGFLYFSHHDAQMPFYENIRNGVKNAFPEDDFCHIDTYKKLVESNIEKLFVLGDHHTSDCWGQPAFINYLNEKNIRTIFFNYEKIFNSFWPCNLEIQKKVKSVANRLQFCSDIDDLDIVSNKVPNKQFVSKSTKFADPIPWEQKENKILFLGCIYGEQYAARANKINALRNLTTLRIPFDIDVTNYKYSYNDFSNIMNRYRYLFNPFGTGTFVNVRHYEARNLGCVVLQEVTDKLMNYYPELNSTCLPFKNISEIPSLLEKQFTHQPEFFLEDYYKQINFRGLVLNALS